jgi:hypothetical protein
MATGRPNTPREFRVAPSDLTFLLNECLRCFYLKVARGIRRPPSPFPGVFTAMDRQQRTFFDGGPTSRLEKSLPSGTLDCSDIRVRSVPLGCTTSGSGIVLGGTLDALARFDNGSWGVADFKTVRAADPTLGKYIMQLQSYVLALEQPYAGPPRKVSQIGLMCFEPEEMIELHDGRFAFAATSTWKPFEREDAGFLAVLRMLCEMLESQKEPPADASCAYCKLR